MTPVNIVNMALLLGYDMIALTDHNSCRNTPAAVKIGGKNGLTVVPGMELCTAEEAHVICLFPTVDAAMRFQRYVADRSVKIKNKPEIFGRQLVLDEQETVIDEEENFLLSAVAISVNDIQKAVHAFGGAAFPAHVDRNAFSIIASLGAIPPEGGFAAAEISLGGDAQKLLQANPELNGKILLLNSDAHYLENMPEPKAWIELPGKAPKYLIAALRGELKINWSLG